MRRAWQLLAIVIAVAALSPAVPGVPEARRHSERASRRVALGTAADSLLRERRRVPGVTASQFRDAVGRAFQTWHAVPSAAVDFSFVGFTGAEPGDQDNASTLGFDTARISSAYSR